MVARLPIYIFASYFSKEGYDTALIPNPFYNLSSVNGSIATPTTIELVDGGESGQNIPLYPLLLDRNVDLVLAVDGSNDENGWPNATSLVITKQYMGWMGVQNRFPPIPNTPEAFVAQGLDKRITVIGCGLQGHNGDSGYTGPIIIYVPNHQATYPSNDSTVKLEYK